SAFDNFKRVRLEWWKRLATPFLDAMLRSREQAQACLEHSDSKVRFVALDVLSHHWEPNRDLAQVCEKMVFSDPDPEIRAVAATTLGACYARTADSRVAKLLANIVSDGSQPSPVRVSAYHSLFAVQGLILEWPGQYTD